MKITVEKAGIRSKLMIATFALILVCGFTLFHGIGAASSFVVLFNSASFLLTVWIIFKCIFSSITFQLFSGWGMVIDIPVMTLMCVLNYRGLFLIWALITILFSLMGAYLLLIDPQIKNYRTRWLMGSIDRGTANQFL